jgi:ABC-2 type transport system ATP-binding protein
MQILGQPVPRHLPDVIGDVGALLESPAFFPPFTGRYNLSLLARSTELPATRVDEVLDQVGLIDAADERVKGYSLGMRQRLGIAAALLKQPQVLVLDEPSNGLDPAGMREVRELLRSLGDGGVTVLLSSHLLGEVQQICDHVTIVNRGRLVTSGRVTEVLAARASGAVSVGIADSLSAAEILTAAGFTVRQDGGGLLVEGVSDGSVVTRALADHGRYVSWLMPVQVDLEQVFLDLTSDEQSAS